MERKDLILMVLALASFYPLSEVAQAWDGVLAPDRAMNWSRAGVAGGIPVRTTVCATLAPGATTAEINNAIANCPNGQVVYLSEGTYSLGSGKIEFARSNVTLRGAGSDKTKLVFTGRNSCGNAGGNVCFGTGGGWIQGGYSSSPTYSADWTGGYANGTSTITLSNTSGLAVGKIIILDQLNDSTDSSGMYVCNTGGKCAYTSGGGDVWGGNRHQRKITTVSAISGTQVTLASPITLTNWRAGQQPKARWSGYTPVKFVGVEDLSVDSTAMSYSSSGTFGFIGTVDSWLKGVRSVMGDRSHVQLYQVTRITIQDSYFHGSRNGISQSYGVELFGASSDVLIQNNILQHNTAPININDGGEGVVVGYNFTIDNFRADSANLMSASYHLHSPGVAMVLVEGNSGLAFVQDNWYGTVHFVTLFRNHLFGDICSSQLDGCPSKNAQTAIIQAAAYSRFFNLVGNVFGRSDYYTSYEASSLGCSATAIYCFGYSHANGGVTDTQTKLRVMRWGNYDTVSGAARFDATEVPSGLAQFANQVPANQSLPASFYLSAKPSWWGSVPWPAVGPDVSGGNITGFNGHANRNPARICWESLATDSQYGTSYATGQVRVFSRAKCYEGDQASSKPLPPTDFTSS